VGNNGKDDDYDYDYDNDDDDDGDGDDDNDSENGTSPRVRARARSGGRSTLQREDRPVAKRLVSRSGTTVSPGEQRRREWVLESGT
jgi:hypothetical protein